MYLCLSSGAQPRYREDILRALAMPAGCRLQFRYHFDIVSPVIRDPLTRGAVIRGRCLIAALAFNHAEGRSEVIPCRVGEIIAAHAHGSIFSLEIELADFAYASNLERYNNELRSLLPGLATWDGAHPPSGELWSFTSQTVEGLQESSELRVWDNIVLQLAGTQSFAEESLYYSVRSIHLLETRERVHPVAGRLTIKPHRVYEVELYHNSPYKEPSGSFHVGVTSELQLISSSDLVLDSNYDLKRIRLSAARHPRERSAILALYHDFGNGEPESPQRRDWHFDLSFRVKAAFWSTIGLAFVVGLLLSGPQILAVFRLTSPPLSSARELIYCLMILVFNWSAAGVAAFHLKRDI